MKGYKNIVTVRIYQIKERTKGMAELIAEVKTKDMLASISSDETLTKKGKREILRFIARELGL